ncbi:MAG TPA: DUF2807 domain-containing protein [Brevundimonas sp.]|nr:DUF2807 domain-containing protein [Brevundimonas sp.]
MKLAIASAVAIAALAGPALAKPGPEVEIRHAVARVAVVVEDRTDVAVEVEQGSSGLPAIQVTREGNEVRIDGGLGGRRGLFGRGDGLRNCRSGPDNARTPGEGASVEVRNHGRINLSDAPLIVIRTPRTVDVDASGAVFGSVGRGATSIELGNSGCGDWNIANTEGRVSLSVTGSGDMRAGTSTALEASIAGAGSITAGATRALDISVSGAGDVAIRGGTAPTLSIDIAGVGDVDFDGVAGDVDVSLAGAGDVNIARATGSVSRSVAGVGDIRIGN